MSSRTDTRLTSRQRLARGLTYSTVGPVDVTRGALGLGAQSVAATVSGIRRAYRGGQLRRDHGKRPWLLAAAVGTVVVAGGAVAFLVIRRSSRPEPSALPPSVQVDPKP